MDNLLGKRCRDKITKVEGICTARIQTMFGSEDYCLESCNPLKTFEPIWLETDRLEEVYSINYDTEKAEKEDLESKRGQIFKK